MESFSKIMRLRELLGHKSSKTTKIYNHVSRKNLLSIKNPLDSILKGRGT